MAEFQVGDRVNVTVQLDAYVRRVEEGVVVPDERPEGPPRLVHVRFKPLEGEPWSDYFAPERLELLPPAAPI